MSSVPSAGQCVCEDVTCLTDTLSWAEGQGRSLGQCECACAYVMTRVGASAVSSPCGAPRRSPPMEGALDLGVRLVAVSCSCVGVAGSSCWWLRRAPRASKRISVCWHRPSSRTVAYPGQARAWEEPSRDGSDTSLERAAVGWRGRVEARNNTVAYRMSVASNIGRTTPFAVERCLPTLFLLPATPSPRPPRSPVSTPPEERHG